MICAVGAAGASVVAFDAETGGTIWKSLDDEAGYSSPVAGAFDGVRQVMVMTGEGMVGVSAESGSLLWRHPMRTPYEQNIMTPVVSDGMVLVSGYTRGCIAKAPGRKA